MTITNQQDVTRGPEKDAAEESASALEPLCLEDLRVGDRWISEFREITSEDVANFATLTGDHDPLHRADGDHRTFGEPVAHGLLGLSVLAGLSSCAPRVATLALIGISDWQFEAPLFFGDRVQVVTEIEEVQQHGRRAGRITWQRQLRNQDGRVLQRGRFISLVASRNRNRHALLTGATDKIRRVSPR